MSITAPTAATRSSAPLPSFTTTRERLATPDLARGGMLLLIALANVTVWMDNPWFADQVGARALAGMPSQIWELLRTGLIDQRAYPLFALLFGFGLAVMAPPPASSARRDPEAARNRRLLRRRGWWMVAFGLVHCLLFAGDIIGAYGFAAVAMAGLIAHRRRKTMVVVGVLCAAPLVVVAALSAFTDMTGLFSANAGGPSAPTATNWWEVWPVGTTVEWALGSTIGLVTSFIVPSIVCGVFLADSGLLRRPQERLGLWWTTAITGLGLALLGGLPLGWQVSGFTSDNPSWTALPFVAGELLGMAGWVAVFALVAAYLTPQEGRTTGPVGRWLAGVLTAVGRRSMTAYLGQSVLFFAAFWGLRFTGLLGELTPGWAAVLAASVWAIMAAVCVAMASRGAAGPPERLLRWLVRRTERTPRGLPSGPQ